MALEWNPATGRAMETGTSAPAVMPRYQDMMARQAPPAQVADMLQQQQVSSSAVMPENHVQAAQMEKLRAAMPTQPKPAVGAPVPDMMYRGGADLGQQQRMAEQAMASMPAVMPQPNLGMATPQPMPLQNMMMSGAGRQYTGPQLTQGQIAASQAQAMPVQSAVPQIDPAPAAPDATAQPMQAQTQKMMVGPAQQPQGNAYGKGGFQPASQMTQAANQRMQGAMGSQAQQAPMQQPDMTTGQEVFQPGGRFGPPAQQRPGKGGAMGGSPQMGGYTPPNNFSRPSYGGGGKGGQQMQQPSPRPSYSGGGKGGGYQRPQRPTYGGKGG